MKLFTMSDIALIKHCTGPCERDLPATLEYFNAHAHGKYGLQPKCKDCKREENRRLRKENPQYFYQYTRMGFPMTKIGEIVGISHASVSRKLNGWPYSELEEAA